MKIATAANSRTTAASRSSLNSGLRIAFSAGAVMGFVVVGLGLLDISFWYFFLKFWYSDPAHLTVAAGQALEEAQVQAITSAMLTFGMGASSMALFARWAAAYSPKRRMWAPTCRQSGSGDSGG